jgi:putative nucleotidyltransferase with HDIG domain
MDENTASQDRNTGQDLSDYAGRWVALAGEQVAGVGDTAVAAERLGRRNRLRERLSVYFVEPEGGQALDLPQQLHQLQPLFRRHDRPIHLVGGAVRDVLLGRQIKDLDFVVPEGAIGLAFKVANSLGLPAYILDRERDSGRVVLPDGETTLDFASYRGDDLLDDLRFRDFTINAMALPVAAQTQASLVDPCQGQIDLDARVIRFTHSSAIEADPVRTMRAARHSVDFEFAIEEATRDAVRKGATLLNTVSVERVRDELMKMMHAIAPANALRAMRDLALLPAVLPEVAALADVPQTPPHFEFALDHTISVMARLTQVEEMVVSDRPQSGANLAEAKQLLAPYRERLAEHLKRRLDGGANGKQVLRLAALLHDVGKSETMTVEPDGRIRFFGHAEVGASITRRRMAKLRQSREVTRQTATIVSGHMRPLLLAQNPKLSRRAIFRFFRDYESAGLDITLLAMADQLALSRTDDSDDHWRRLLEVVGQLHRHYFEHFDETVQPVAFLDGSDLMEILQIDPGPKVGQLLGRLLEAQAAGEVNDRAEAVALVTRLAAETGE